MGRLTQVEYLQKCLAVHGSKYLYTKTSYLKSSERVTITCHEHGDFTMVASEHVAGKGCKKCAIKAQTKTFEDFEARAQKIHCGAYSYLPDGYKDHKSPITAVCQKHGNFLTTPNRHLAGSGCKSCANEALKLTPNEFLDRSRLAHGDKYDYSLTEYAHSLSKVKIICKEHGVFLQGAHHHMVGRGCPQCAGYGYQEGLPGTLYILNNGEYTKIGITNLPVKKRIPQLNSKGKCFSAYAEFNFSDGSKAKQLEVRLLKILKLGYLQPLENFEGYTECFYDLPPARVVDLILSFGGEDEPDTDPK